MKKQKKKLTPKQKEELKAKLKKATFTMLHVVSYICTALFVLVCVVACVQNVKAKKQSNNKSNNDNTPVVNRLYEPLRANANEPIKPEASDRYFYPYDIDVTGWHTLHLDFSNYNYLQYFLPDLYKLLNYNEDLYEYLMEPNDLIVDFDLRKFNVSTGVYETNPDMYVSISINGLDSYSFNLNVNQGHMIRVFTLFSFDDNGNFNTNDFLNTPFEDVFDDLFLSGLYQVQLKEDDAYCYIVASFLYYYMSDRSFDFNSYMFGGLGKYTSIMSIFRRVYNGFFVYLPHNDEITLDVTLFKGVWQYSNVIYNEIVLTLQRAWNKPGDYEIEYTLNPTNNSALEFLSSIFDGSSSALEHYYFVRSIHMISVNGSELRLAYNEIHENWEIESPGTDPNNRILHSVVWVSNNLNLWNDNSFLNNSNINFVLYSIDYDYNFYNSAFNYLNYRYFSDFFFTAFYYTGLYHSTPPTENNTDIEVLIPVVSMLAIALTGILPLLNAYILPGVSLGTLLALPFIVSIILFVVKLFKR